MLSRPSRQIVKTVDASEDVLRDIGQLLRETRQNRGEDAYDIAEYLRIRPAYLFALEQGDLSIMPGRPYAMGFLRTYGDYLDLDGNELVQRVRRAKDAAIANPELVCRTPASESRRPAKLLIAASLVGAAFVYGSWYLSYSGFTSLLDKVAALPAAVGEVATSLLTPDEVDTPAGAQVTTAESGSSVARDAGAPRTPAAPSVSLDELRLSAPDPSSQPAAAVVPVGGSDGTSALAAEAVPPDARQTAAPPTAAAESAGELLAALETPAAAPAAGGRTFGAAGEAGRIVLIARESSWIQVRSGSRDYVRTRTLEPGDRFVLPNRNDLALWTGNAGGLEVEIDGRSLGTLGASGAVIRQVALTPQELQARTAAARQ